MKLSWLFVALLALAMAANGQGAPAAFRPPAVPLAAVDPYFSIWSFADHLTYDATRHWTGARMTMQSLIRVDGHAYRLMGDEPKDVTPARQLRLQVFPTRTIYDFQAANILVRLTFLTPDLPRQLDILSRPVTYLTWEAHSLDGKQHQVEIYFDNTAELVVNTPDEPVAWESESIPGLRALRMGTSAQPILGRAGDFTRIDWGYLYVAAPLDESPQDTVLPEEAALQEFISHGQLNSPMDVRMPCAANDQWPVMAFAFSLGAVGAEPVSRHLLLAYDEIYPVEYFGKRLHPFWQRGGVTINALLQSAEHDFSSLRTRSQQFDQELMADLTRMGGEQYADVSALAYRQAFAANTLAVGPDGQLLMFLKEISSCGCAQTADVIYPESPLLLLVNPGLLEDSLIPLLDYAQSGQWPYPYAPHDLGAYPLDNVRDPAQMESMPVEETGNMLLMIAGIARAEGTAEFASRYWSLLTKWADYLKANGLDPGDQLCTDDFTGLLRHNANLSLKAIEALGGYAMLARMLGKTSVSEAFRHTAEQDAAKWMQMAGGHGPTRLAFDRPGTWSQKYNLVWDRVLGIRLFPASLARQELDYYHSRSTAFGFPLDTRAAFTKLDWESWSAALATSKAQFSDLFSGVYNFAERSPIRVPFSDWYWTVDGTPAGFQARPVVGGVYMQMLTNPSVWKKWAASATANHRTRIH
jgi:Domain of unknown function (DUF4965)/Domain of unknown function (DUF5127)/Domain of unknown function (DUF1793)/Domain of unknown function (DUF4964)